MFERCYPELKLGALQPRMPRMPRKPRKLANCPICMNQIYFFDCGSTKNTILIVEIFRGVK